MTTDYQIQQDAVLALQWEPRLKDSDIAIAVREGIVTLAGFTHSHTQRWFAEHVVSLVRGVKGIANDLEVRLPAPSARLDSEIARAAVHAMRWHSSVPEGRVQVSVEQGWIRLEGEVDWPYQRQTAELAVKTLTGVRGVSNRITVKAPPVPTRILRRRVGPDADHLAVPLTGSDAILGERSVPWRRR
jgi:osmotically-inducible protein OsmY